MHVVGARFARLAAALAALREIRARVATPSTDVDVRPLGSTEYEETAADFLLAGRFEPDDVDAVVDIADRHGGTLLARHPEWIHPSLQRVDAPAEERHRSAGPGGPVAGRGALSLRDHRPHKRLRRPAALVRGRAARDRRVSR